MSPVRKLTTPESFSNKNREEYKRRSPSKFSDYIATVLWQTKQTLNRIEENIKYNGEEGICGYCGFRTSKRRVRIHVRQYYCLYFCTCQYWNSSQDRVYTSIQSERQNDNHNQNKFTVYMVNLQNYDDLTKKFICKDFPSSIYTLQLCLK